MMPFVPTTVSRITAATVCAPLVLEGLLEVRRARAPGRVRVAGRQRYVFGRACGRRRARRARRPAARLAGELTARSVAPW